jgi:hypothetical protein
MELTSLAQSDGYSGASHPWLNPHASYHRMTYENRTHIHSYESSLQLIRELKREFSGSERSRLVVRFLTGINRDELIRYQSDIHNLGWYLSYYTDQTPGTHIPFSYMTYSENKKMRNINASTTANLVSLNRWYITKQLERIGTGGDFRLEQLAQFQSRWFRVVDDIDTPELTDLWQPFWWSADACDQILGSQDGSFLLWVRDRYSQLIASILYSHQPHILEDGTHINHGELTEATTLPVYRGHGIMWVLATALHVRALERDIRNIYGEYRALSSEGPHSIQSLRFALESGVTFAPGDILTNHVDIDDIVDTHNTDRHIPGYGSGAEQLKSFMLGSLDPSNITPSIRQAYRNAF